MGPDVSEKVVYALYVLENAARVLPPIALRTTAPVKPVMRLLHLLQSFVRFRLPSLTISGTNLERKIAVMEKRLCDICGHSRAAHVDGVHCALCRCSSERPAAVQ